MSKNSYLPKLNVANQELTNSEKVFINTIGSITPRTLESRTYEKSLNDTWFKDVYKFDSSTVTSYRINKEKIPKSKEEEKNKQALEKILGNVEVKVISKKASSVNSKNYTESDLNKVQYTNIEKQVFLKALDHLLVNNEQVVLVDILEREKSELITTKVTVTEKDVTTGSITTKEEIKPIETHTIVLYRNPGSASTKQEIIVLDPSNFIFSSHLRNLQDQEDFKQLQSSNPFTIKTKHATLPIYKHETSSHRDCIDIAVKIALTLISNKENINLIEIEKSEMFKLLSNQSVITSKQNPVLIKQTSSTETVKAFNKIEEVIKENLKNFRLIKSIKSDTIEKEHNDILFNSQKIYNKDLIKNLLSFNEKCTFEFKTEVETMVNDMAQNQFNLAGEIDITNNNYI